MISASAEINNMPPQCVDEIFCMIKLRWWERERQTDRERQRQRQRERETETETEREREKQRERETERERERDREHYIKGFLEDLLFCEIFWGILYQLSMLNNPPVNIEWFNR